MGLHLAEPGFRTRLWVEIEKYPQQVIIAAQRAGYFTAADIWDDLTTFDGRPFRGAFDAILAGYPCQPFSQAGQRKGADDERHLWPDVARIIREIEPEWVFLENVAGHVSLGAETVLRDLWDMGFTPAAGLFSASETGAPHERLRWFCVAHRSQERCEGGERQRKQHGIGAQFGDHSRTSVAHADGGNAGPERQQRGGQLGFQPEGRGIGAGDVVHAECPERRSDATGRNITDGDDAGRDQAPGWVGKPDAPMGHPPRLGCGEGRAEPSLRVGRDTAPGSGGTMADASEPRPEGREQRRSSDEWHGAAASGSTAEFRRACLFPPGPGDADAWAAVLRSAPDMAPAAAARDLHAWARRLEADGREWWKATAEPEFRRLVDGLADRSSKLRLLGNGVAPLAAGYAWRTLSAAHGLWCVDLEAASGADGTDADGVVVRAAE